MLIMIPLPMSTPVIGTISQMDLAGIGIGGAGPVKPGDRILDLCCGTGDLARQLNL
ncbi:hypothetical protein GCM10007416_08820 [Kroppenstedtia guangzhouensis]|uniref:Uncharacterized protein n=1 Tax=Kroppenstedtia guangzhouensis TaxID=1274356 RepID=A0ABQ1G7A2_9BACL|nr:hypothetical protein GCM10007416_08820 [Kroppenstedtia guangzhouensis]